MKTKLQIVVAILLATLTDTHFAYAGTRPVAEDQGSTTMFVEPAKGQAFTGHPAQAGVGVPTITMFAMVAPKGYITNWATKVLPFLTSGTVLTRTSSFRYSPMDATTADNAFMWPEDITALPGSSTEFYWRGTFGPTGDASTNKGDFIIAWVNVKAPPGGSVAMSEVKFISSSTDGANNTLGKTATFELLGYSPIAPGFTLAGQAVTNSSTSNTVDSFWLGVAVPNYAVSSQSQLDGVRSYLSSFGTVTCRIEFQIVRDGGVIASNVTSLILTTNAGWGHAVVLDTDNVRFPLAGGTKPEYDILGSLRIESPSQTSIWTNTTAKVRPRQPFARNTAQQFEDFKLAP